MGKSPDNFAQVNLMNSSNRKEIQPRIGHDALQVPSRQSSTARTPSSMKYDSRWVQSSLNQFNFLLSVRSVDVEAGPVIGFAIRWAPFGGTSPGDLLVAFGVGRRRFTEMLRASLRPRRGDSHEARQLKRALSDALMSAWSADEMPTVDPVHC